MQRALWCFSFFFFECHMTYLHVTSITLTEKRDLDPGQVCLIYKVKIYQQVINNTLLKTDVLCEFASQ